MSMGGHVNDSLDLVFRVFIGMHTAVTPISTAAGVVHTAVVPSVPA